MTTCSEEHTTSIFYTAVGVPFIPEIAQGIQTRWPCGETRAQAMVLLPTQRACLALKRALQKCTPHAIQLFPKIIALSDLEKSPRVPGLKPRQNPPTHTPWQRLGKMLTIIQNNHVFPQYSWEQLRQVAQEILAIIDAMHIMGMHTLNLETLNLADYPEHRALSLEILAPLIGAWFQDETLYQRDSAYHGYHNLMYLATHWQPTYPVLIAGTTATRPATYSLVQHLLQWGATLPGCDAANNSIVLAGVDPQALTTPLPLDHPQYAFQLLLDKLHVRIDQIKPWSQRAHTPPKHAVFVNTALAIAPSAPAPVATEDMSQTLIPLTCQNPLHEIHTIGALVCDHLARGCPSVSIIMPDPNSTYMLSDYLKRWKINANTSLGTPLGQTAVGRFLNLIRCLHHRSSTTDWLALLQHPLFFKPQRAEHLNHLRHWLESVYYTQPYAIPGDFFQTRRLPPDLRSWAKRIEDILQPWLNLTGKHDLEVWLQHHQTVAEALASPEVLWGHIDGKKAAQALTQLQETSSVFRTLKRAHYNDLFQHTFDPIPVHTGENIRAPVTILGSLEARLNDAEVCILSGLNEGTWPAPHHTPWLTASMQARVGFIHPARWTGLSAHDFCSGFQSSIVYLTRAQCNTQGRPTRTSRWWQQLTTAAQRTGIDLETTPRIQKIQSAVTQLDQSSSLQQTHSPNPKPAPHLRPRTLSITDIELLVRDPYSYYAKRILKLRPLQPPAQKLTPRLWGIWIHQALELFLHQERTSQTPESFCTLVEEQIPESFQDVHFQIFQKPRLKRMAQWLIAYTAPHNHTQEFFEIAGRTTLTSSEETFTIHGIADHIRIDDTQRCWEIIDYKTGALPSIQSVARGFSPQIILEGWLALCGGFPVEGPPHPDTIRGSYWQLAGYDSGGKILPLPGLESYIELCDRRLGSFLEHFVQAKTGYICAPWGEAMCRVTDYHHLARLSVWKA